MNGAKLILSVGICLGVAGAIASGCGASSSNPGPGPDSGPSPDVGETDVIADAGGASCNPFTLRPLSRGSNVLLLGASWHLCAPGCHLQRPFPGELPEHRHVPRRRGVLRRPAV